MVVPTAPIPVHTAYAVPIGSVCVAFINRYMLIVRQNTKPVYQYVAIVPCVSLALPKQVANPTSNKPAMINITQFIVIAILENTEFVNECKVPLRPATGIIQLIKNESAFARPYPAERYLGNT